MAEGLSLRFIKAYVPEKASMVDIALMLAEADDREDVPMTQKIADAIAFIKSRIH